MAEDLDSVNGPGYTLDRRTVLKLLGAMGMTGTAASSTMAAETKASESNDEFDPIEATVTDVISAIVDGNATAANIVETYLGRIEAYDEALNSIINVNPNAVDRAEELDEQFDKSGPVGPLHGVPIVLKDNYDTGDLPTTGASLALEDSIPPDDAYMVERLREAGAVVIAKANLHEYALGGTTVSSLGGATRNAYDLGRTPAGSSGGTGAAVAANLAVFGTGSDTGGSIRMPAAYGDLVGLRPTLGVLSRDGIIPISLTKDTGGYLTRTVTDTALALDATVGYDPTDRYTARAADKIPTEESPLPEDSYTEYLTLDGLEGARIGVYRDFFGIEADLVEGEVENEDQAREDAAEVTAVVEQALEDMEELGATIIDPVSVGPLDELNEMIEAADTPEAERKRDLNGYFDSLGDDAEIESVEELVESELYACDIAEPLREENEASTDDLEEKLLSSYGGRVVLRNAVLTMMADNGLDTIVYPTLARSPSPIGEELNGYGLDFSPEADMPAISVPAGFTEDDHLPVGIELVGRRFDDPLLLNLAYAYEQGTDHRHPPGGFGTLPNEPPEVEEEYTVPVAENGCD
jgi:Asp-tRNA(Asn)/Glu-tRNA(Gln) amidotransferase A subunit family amidase